MVVIISLVVTCAKTFVCRWFPLTAYLPATRPLCPSRISLLPARDQTRFVVAL